MKKIQKKEQYSNAKIRILPKPSPKNNGRKRERELLKICKGEASKTAVPYAK